MKFWKLSWHKTDTDSVALQKSGIAFNKNKAQCKIIIMDAGIESAEHVFDWTIINNQSLECYDFNDKQHVSNKKQSCLSNEKATEYIFICFSKIHASNDNAHSILDPEATKRCHLQQRGSMSLTKLLRHNTGRRQFVGQYKDFRRHYWQSLVLRGVRCSIICWGCDPYS